MPRNALQRVKTTVLPRGKQSRRLPIGIGRGIRLDIDFSVQTKIFLGLYEIELNKYLRRLCRPSLNCFDVGAQFGYDALLLAKLTGGRVASFECDVEMIDELVRNIHSNVELGARIEIVKGFVTAETHEPTGSLALDDIAFGGRSFIPDFIKMDIEGGEFEALVGARRILTERRPNLLIETHSRRLETHCLEYVRSFGYHTTIVEARKLFPDYRPVEHNRWFVASHGRATISANGSDAAEHPPSIS